MEFVERVGDSVLSVLGRAADVADMSVRALSLAVRPGSWPRTVRQTWSRQMLFTGVDATGLIVLMGVLAGLSVVAQAQVWLSRFGQSGAVGPILVAILIREIGPLLVNLLVIGRSGTAISTELAGMSVRGEIEVLEATGIDPMTYLVMPRVTCMLLSVLCLTAILVGVSLITGYVFGFLLKVTPGDIVLFSDSVFGTMDATDTANFFAKTLIPGLASGTICCLEGMDTSGSVTEIPKAGTRAVVRSTAAVLVISSVVSVLTYG